MEICPMGTRRKELFCKIITFLIQGKGEPIIWQRMPSSLWFIPLWWEVINSCPSSFRGPEMLQLVKTIREWHMPLNVAVVISELWDYGINSFFFFILFQPSLSFLCIYKKSKNRGLPGEALGSRSQPLAWFSLESMEANALFMASVSFWRKVSIIFFAKTEIPWNKVRQRRSYTINIQ